MREASVQYAKAKCKCNMRAYATYNAQRERHANAKRATKRKLDNARAWQKQAHRSARTAKRKCDARARSITRRANATCKCRMFDAKTQHKSSNGCHVPHVPAQHAVCEQPDDDEDSKTQDQDRPGTDQPGDQVKKHQTYATHKGATQGATAKCYCCMQVRNANAVCTGEHTDANFKCDVRTRSV